YCIYSHNVTSWKALIGPELWVNNRGYRRGNKDMPAILRVEGNRLIRRYDSEILWIEPWGENSLRVRATHEGKMPERDWALLPVENAKAEINISNHSATIRNGKIRAEV